MPPPSSVTVALSAEESRSLREAADVLSVPLARLLAAAAVTFSRLCGFRKTATASVRRSPNWGPPPEPELPEEILEVPLDPDTAEQVEAAAGYVRWDGPTGVLSVTLSEYVVGAAMRLIRETRVEGSPPSFRGLADQLFALSRPRGESSFRASMAGAPPAPPDVEPATEPTFVRAVAPPPPTRPSYTLPRPPRPERDPPEAPPGKRDRSEPSRAERGKSATRAPVAKPARGSTHAEGRAASTGRTAKSPPPAEPSVGPLAWLRQRPLVLAAAAAAVVLLGVLVSAYLLATAPTEGRGPPPTAATAPATRAVESRPAANDALRLDPAPATGETAAGALKRWEDIAPGGPDVPASAPPSSRNHGKNIDALLAERYGRPKVLADASLKPEAYDADIAAAVTDVARIYPVPPALVKAVIRRESNFNPNALSQVGAIGMMQLMPYTAKKVGLRVSDLWVPRKNILGGTRLLSALLQYYDGDVISALTAYNARPREPLAPLPKNGETPEYVAAVLRFFEEYNGAPLHRTPQTNPLDAPLRP